jgi:predicted TIM-barrel fold metal-dependent hydrolase
MLSRRGFLSGTLGAGFALAAAPGLASAQGVQAARPRRIVDAQVHLWKANTPDRPWPPNTVAQLPEPFGYDQLLPMMNEAEVERVVIVPPGWEGARNDYGLEAHAKYPDRFGFMGRIPLTDPQSAAFLVRWKDQPGMMGIRVTFNSEAAAFRSGAVDWLWPTVEKAGLPVMFYAPGNLPFFAQIAERQPRLQLIIDHMGLSPEITKANTRENAIAQAAALAKYPNVSVKLSSSPLFSLDPYPYRDLAPLIERLFDSFGPQRCYWGTDMTNSFARATYRQRITHFTEELPFLSEDDKDWVMGRAILKRLNWA